MTGTARNLAGFTGAGYDRGRSLPWQIAWLTVSGLIVMRWWCPTRVRISILRLFGAKIGTGVNLRHNVRIHWPWKLSIGDHSWIGEDTWILNLEPVVIGSHVCISQDVLLCTGSHDRRSPTFEFDNGPITIDDGAWVAARATVLRGSVIGRDAVIGATALVAGTKVAPGGVMVAPVAVEWNPAERAGTARTAGNT
jgi:putative colanic acid biosynthesis acetyltransferase WcaF